MLDEARVPEGTTMTLNGRRLIVGWTAALIAAALVATFGSLPVAATGPFVLLVILLEVMVLGARQRSVLRVARPGLELQVFGDSGFRTTTPFYVLSVLL